MQKNGRLPALDAVSTLGNAARPNVPSADNEQSQPVTRMNRSISNPEIRPQNYRRTRSDSEWSNSSGLSRPGSSFLLNSLSRNATSASRQRKNSMAPIFDTDNKEQEVEMNSSSSKKSKPEDNDEYAKVKHKDSLSALQAMRQQLANYSLDEVHTRTQIFKRSLTTKEQVEIKRDYKYLLLPEDLHKNEGVSLQERQDTLKLHVAMDERLKAVEHRLTNTYSKVQESYDERCVFSGETNRFRAQLLLNHDLKEETQVSVMYDHAVQKLNKEKEAPSERELKRQREFKLRHEFESKIAGLKLQKKDALGRLEERLRMFPTEDEEDRKEEEFLEQMEMERAKAIASGKMISIANQRQRIRMNKKKMMEAAKLVRPALMQNSPAGGLLQRSSRRARPSMHAVSAAALAVSKKTGGEQRASVVQSPNTNQLVGGAGRPARRRRSALGKSKSAAELTPLETPTNKKKKKRNDKPWRHRMAKMDSKIHTQPKPAVMHRVGGILTMSRPQAQAKISVPTILSELNALSTEINDTLVHQDIDLSPTHKKVRQKYNALQQMKQPRAMTPVIDIEAQQRQASNASFLQHYTTSKESKADTEIKRQRDAFESNEEEKATVAAMAATSFTVKQHKHRFMVVGKNKHETGPIVSILENMGYMYISELDQSSYFRVLRTQSYKYDMVLVPNTDAGKATLFQIQNSTARDLQCIVVAFEQYRYSYLDVAKWIREGAKGVLYEEELRNPLNKAFVISKFFNIAGIPKAERVSNTVKNMLARHRKKIAMKKQALNSMLPPSEQIRDKLQGGSLAVLASKAFSSKREEEDAKSKLIQDRVTTFWAKCGYSDEMRAEMLMNFSGDSIQYFEPVLSMGEELVQMIQNRFQMLNENPNLKRLYDMMVKKQFQIRQRKKEEAAKALEEKNKEEENMRVKAALFQMSGRARRRSSLGALMDKNRKNSVLGKLNKQVNHGKNTNNLMLARRGSNAMFVEASVNRGQDPIPPVAEPAKEAEPLLPYVPDQLKSDFFDLDRRINGLVSELLDTYKLNFIWSGKEYKTLGVLHHDEDLTM